MDFFCKNTGFFYKTCYTENRIRCIEIIKTFHKSFSLGRPADGVIFYSSDTITVKSAVTP